VSIGPLAAISPAYMTAARPQVWATTGRSWVTSTSARPSSDDSRVSRSRICACTITSSAVVGSSASRILGWQASAMEIDARCRMPPESSRGEAPDAAGDLVRVALGGGGRNAAHLEQLAGPPPGRRALRDAVEGHRLGDLPADLLHRVEGVHRALEHHRDVLPAGAAGRALDAGHDVLPIHADLPAHR